MKTTIIAAIALIGLVTPALADDAIRPSGPPLVIQGSVGSLVPAPSRVENVFVGDPAIADVQVPAGGQYVFVFGKRAGTTAFYAMGGDGQVVMSRTVTVSGPKTVRVMRGSQTYIWSEAHGDPTNGNGSDSPTLNDLPKGSAVTIPVGSK